MNRRLYRSYLKCRLSCLMGILYRNKQCYRDCFFCKVFIAFSCKCCRCQVVKKNLQNHFTNMNANGYFSVDVSIIKMFLLTSLLLKKLFWFEFFLFFSNTDFLIIKRHTHCKNLFTHVLTSSALTIYLLLLQPLNPIEDSWKMYKTRAVNKIQKDLLSTHLANE